MIRHAGVCLWATPLTQHHRLTLSWTAAGQKWIKSLPMRLGARVGLYCAKFGRYFPRYIHISTGCPLLCEKGADMAVSWEKSAAWSGFSLVFIFARFSEDTRLVTKTLWETTWRYKPIRNRFSKVFRYGNSDNFPRIGTFITESCWMMQPCAINLEQHTRYTTHDVWLGVGFALLNKLISL